MLKKKGFTLIEILVVLIIVGILAALAWPNYMAIKEKTLNREARASLALIRAAEKIYRMEQNYYYPFSTTTNVISDINRDLKLSLPESASVSWSISLNSVGAPQYGTATRTGVGVDGRTWRIDFPGDVDPSCTGGS
ncbi:MAG: type II secretion system GspH family protein, partial [Candidatus Omnitrophica bacterium]|nr:type II secretion system GspH family protein [Candidatus Omnitrophota bacterium]